MIAVTIILLMTIPTAFLIIYMEMKIIALMNLRIGPDRVGPFGSLLSVVHGLKVLMKEDFTPTGADSLVFTWAPVVVYLASVMSLLVIPFSNGIVGADLNLGLLYFFAVGGLSVVGLMMAGWSSYNKYSLLGALRAAAQVVSYEIPLTLSVVGLILLAGTMSLNAIVEQQAGWFTSWYVFQQPLGALIFFIAATAEANRTPFDLTEADSEIVAGFATEYSGMRFGFFFFAEYVNVFIVSALLVTLFLGGWNAPFPFPRIDLNIDLASFNVGLVVIAAVAPLIVTLLFAAPFYLISSRVKWWQALIAGFVLANLFLIALVGAWAYIGLDWVAGILWFMGKTYVFVFTFVWMRGTLPRVRIDQLMDFAWKWLLPVSLLNLFVTAAAIIVVKSIRRDELRPGPRHREGHGADAAPVLRAEGHGHVSRGAARRPAQVPWPPPAALRRVRHAQVRDVLPVRAGVSDRVHRHGRHRHARPLSRPLGRARDVRRAARGIGAPAIRTDRARPGVSAVRGRRSRRSRPDPRGRRPRSREDARDPRGDPDRLRLPAGRRAQAHQPCDRRVVRADLRDRHLLRATSASSRQRRRNRRPRSSRIAAAEFDLSLPPSAARSTEAVRAPARRPAA